MSKTRWGIVASSVIVLLLASLLGYIFQQQSVEMDDSYNKVEHTHDVLDNLWGLRVKTQMAEGLMDIYLLSRDPDTLKQFHDIRDAIPGAIQYLKSLERDNARQLHRLEMVVETIESRMRLLESHAKENLTADRLPFLRVMRERLEKSDRLEELIQEIAREERSLLSTRQDRFDQKISRFRLAAGLTMGVAVILLGGIAIMLCKEQHKRDHYESRLLAARDAALDSVQATSTFVATVSHEIRTPMNGVLGTADLMLRDHTLTPRQREGLDTIRSSGKSLMAIINDILDLSKLQAGEMKLHNEAFSLEEVVEDVVALFAASATRKNLELTPHLAPDLPRQLMGDHLRLRQVLGNLVSNAIKFTERGGVTVHVVRRPDMETDGRACLRFEVRDTGPGIAKEDQARLFQPFSQVDVKLAQRHGGTGLGLAISRELVLRMNGTLNVESSRGQGATFWFTACFTIVEEAFEPPVLESRPILIALENRPMTADAMREHATAWGLKPMVYGHVADIPRQAPWSSHAMEQPTRAVVIISHTAQDWLEQIRHLRQLEWLKGVPVFLMTDQEDISAEQMAREGLQATLHYPFRPSDLYDHLVGAEVAVAKEEVPSRPLQLPRARVIVADDNPVNQRVLGNQLEYLGLEVVPCVNGREAVARVKAGEGVLVLMDCEMPEMDGYEASRKIREWERANKRAPIPIIAVTAHVMAGALEQCLECGMSSYLTKPMEIEKLQQMLLKWLPKQGGQEAEAAASPMTAAAPAASAPLEVVNEAQLRSCLKGDSALDQDLVRMAVSQIDEMLAKMRRALEQGLDAEWKQAAHRSRGSSGTLGFTRLAALFQTAEFEATSREARGEVLSQLEQAHDELVARLEEMKIMDTTMPL